MQDRIRALKAAIAASVEVPSVLPHARRSAADVVSNLAWIGIGEDSAIALAADVSDAISGGAAMVQATVHGIDVTFVETDDSDFDFALRLNGREAVEIVIDPDGLVIYQEIDEQLLSATRDAAGATA